MKVRILVMILAAAGAACASDAPQQIFDLFSNIASALSDDDPAVFIEAVDPNMPHFYDFRAMLTALVGEADLTNSVEVMTDTGDDKHRTTELDWVLHLADKAGSHTIEERHKAVTFKLERKGKKWKIVSIDPMNFFAPPKGI